MKMLLLASDFGVSQKLAAPIRGKGWEAFFATEAAYALPVALKVNPDVIIVDGLLLGGGMRAITDLRASVHTASVPMIVISNDEAQSSEELMAAGVQHCFAPPLNVDLIIAKIDELLANPIAVTQAPEKIINDAQRLGSLEKTGLLDSEPEECYDALTSLAAKLLNAPTALMSLVDNDRQFFKSQHGLGEPWSTARQTPLSHSFCQWVVSSDNELVVDDAREHAVLSDNGAVHDLGVIAYIGVPLAIDPEHPVGSFCTLDSSPHEWTETDLENLKDMAKIINAFVVVQMIGNSELPSAAEISTARLVQSASNAIVGATNILTRGGERLDDSARSQLEELAGVWSEELRAFASAGI